MALCCAIFLGSCTSEESMAVYSTKDESASLYVLNEDRFFFGPTFEESGQIRTLLEDAGERVGVDRFGCRHFGPLIIPSAIDSLECEGVTFRRYVDELQKTSLRGLEQSRRHEVHIYLEQGSDVIESFSIYPDDSGENTYFARDKKRLRLLGDGVRW